jgi:endonuclease YncB( thermonuclease family)
LRGIDAPELKSICAATREAGQQARAALASLTSDQDEIQLTHISGDKYFGRVVADISFSDGRNPAQEMLSAGYVSPYGGGGKTKTCSTW